MKLYQSLAFAILASLIEPIWSIDSIGEIGDNATLVRSRRQANGCNYNFQFNSVGQSAYLKSPGYPQSYGPNIDCRYTITSPPGTKMDVQCSDFNVEGSQNCQYDVLFMSLSGDVSFRDQQFFCGQGGFTRSTQGNKLAVGFRSDESNPQSNVPFRYQCQISVVAGNQQPSCSCGIRNLVKNILAHWFRNETFNLEESYTHIWIFDEIWKSNLELSEVKMLQSASSRGVAHCTLDY